MAHSCLFKSACLHVFNLFGLFLGRAGQGLVQASGEHHVVSLEDVTVAEQMADTSPVAWSMMLPKPSPVYR